ncbi:hypothetical protein ACFDTO_14905 [Microbacteriaceae bacterium 4G12]
MDYLLEAVVIIVALLFPLGCVILFLRGMIKSLGDPHTITPVPDDVHGEDK